MGHTLDVVAESPEVACLLKSQFLTPTRITGSELQIYKLYALQANLLSIMVGKHFPNVHKSYHFNGL